MKGNEGRVQAQDSRLLALQWAIWRSFLQQVTHITVPLSPTFRPTPRKPPYAPVLRPGFYRHLFLASCTLSRCFFMTCKTWNCTTIWYVSVRRSASCFASASHLLPSSGLTLPWLGISTCISTRFVHFGRNAVRGEGANRNKREERYRSTPVRRHSLDGRLRLCAKRIFEFCRRP